MNIMKKLLLSIGTCIFLGAFLTACNTAEGFGEDLQKGGKAISKSATEKSSNS